MADRSQPDFVKSLRFWGFNTLKIQDAKRWGNKLDTPQPALPDNWAYINGRLVFGEVKDGYPSFDFNDWRTNQREWATKWAIGLNTPYWIWLCLGLDSPTRKPKTGDWQPRMTYLLPYHVMIEAEQKLAPYQATLPYRAKHALIPIQEQGLDAPTLLKKWRLDYKSYQLWTLPGDHPFRKLYLEAQPLPLPHIGEPLLWTA